MNGFYNCILYIDLTKKHYRVETVDTRIYETYLGGKGLGSHLLFSVNPPKVDPFDAENRLIIAIGSATGTSIWGGSRYGVFTKSPLTGFYSESYSGGKTPEAIAATGFDAIVIHGKCDQPSILIIRPEEVIFKPANELWGMSTEKTELTLRKNIKNKDHSGQKSGILAIGPAGENQVCFSVISNDFHHVAGRTGTGAVMGSKHLKAILFEGDRIRQPVHENRLKEFAKQIADKSKTDPGVKAYRSLGTPMMVKITNQAGAFPTRYWSQGEAPHWESVSADALHSRCKVTPKTCVKCMMACGRMTTLQHGRHKGLTIKGPEYETIYAFGGLCMVTEIEEIAYLNQICNHLGMDTMTAGNLCGFTIEAVNAGKIRHKIDYGDVDGMANLLHMIADKEGIGDILSRGITSAAREFNMEDRAVHVKGLEPAGYDPRILKGMGLGYSVADRGACHLRSTFYKPELAGLIPADQVEGKARLFIDFEDRLTLFDTLILCRFFRDLYPWDAIQTIIEGTTGFLKDRKGLKKTAAAVTDIVRKFNLREGMTSEDDRLPEWFYTKPLKNGKKITKEEVDFMKADYYMLRNWDKDGVPKS